VSFGLKGRDGAAVNPQEGPPDGARDAHTDGVCAPPAAAPPRAGTTLVRPLPGASHPPCRTGESGCTTASRLARTRRRGEGDGGSLWRCAGAWTTRARLPSSKSSMARTLTPSSQRSGSTSRQWTTAGLLRSAPALSVRMCVCCASWPRVAHPGRWLTGRGVRQVQAQHLGRWRPEDVAQVTHTPCRPVPCVGSVGDRGLCLCVSE